MTVALQPYSQSLLWSFRQNAWTVALLMCLSTLDLQSVIGTSYLPDAVAPTAKGAVMYIYTKCQCHMLKYFLCFDVYDGKFSLIIHTWSH